MMKSSSISALSVLSFAALGTGYCFGESAAGIKPAKPNIVLLYADDLGYGDVSCNGAKRVKTPNIDKMAGEGLRFTDAHAAAATCTPSRYSLLTGEYPWRKKGTGVLPGDAAMIIQPGRETLPAVLKKAGYTTGIVGKWHLGLGDGRAPIDWNKPINVTPLDVGFDYSFIMAATADRVPCVYIEGRAVVGLDPADPIKVSYRNAFPGEKNLNRCSCGAGHRGGNVINKPEHKFFSDVPITQQPQDHQHIDTILDGIPRIGYMTGGKAALWTDDDMAQTYVKKAGEFIDKHAGAEKPFFLFFATNDIHVPRVANPAFAGKSELGTRGDVIAQFDWCVGEIFKKIKERGLDENTLVIFSSDNGPVVDDGYEDGSREKLGAHKPAGEFRGGKYIVYEGGTRMPFVVRWPEKVKPGTSDALVGQFDLLASFAALTGVDYDKHDAPDSQNVLPALLGQSKKGRATLIEEGGRLALREGNWKCIFPNKLSLDNLSSAELYDLGADVSEKKNLAKQMPARVKAMAEIMLAERAKGDAGKR